MKKIMFIFSAILYTQGFSQELLATVQVNSQQIGGSNQQAFKALEKSLRDFINNTSWTGKKLQNFEKIKCGFAIVISERDVNKFKGSLCRQYVLFTIQHEIPLLNLQDQRFALNILRMKTLFSMKDSFRKNLTDVISFYIYLILGYDADSFQSMGGTQWFQKHSRLLRTLKTETMKAGIPSMNQEAVPSDQ
jgi:hypothetical protein